MKPTLFLFLFLLCSSLLFGQNNRLIFDSLRVYHYEALFINEKGDTLSSESVSLHPTGKTWNADPQQDIAIFKYNSSDSIVSLFPNPTRNKKNDKPLYYSNEVSTGVIETNDRIWIHPFRSNQYKYTEVAPFPQVKNPGKLKVGDQYSGGKLFIMSGWGAFKGKVTSEFEVTGIRNYTLNNQTIENCIEINGIGKHNKLGKSNLKMLFHQDYGFLEMHYLTYDRNRILFSLKEVKELK